jgi:dihydroorotate dehydrogenase
LSFYKSIFRPSLFLLDSEVAHTTSLKVCELASFKLVRYFLEKLFSFNDSTLNVCEFGLNFNNPVGIAAGLDKNGIAIPFFSSIGAGFVEIGTVTPVSQAGNPKPRMHRVIPHESLINSLGFPSSGVQEVARNVEKFKKRYQSFPVGVNIGKNKDTSNDEAIEDYQACFALLAPLADYIVVNISSPNTPGLRDLQNPDWISNLIKKLRSLKILCPLLLKISPDLTDSDLYEILDVCLELKLDGIICTNTTMDKSELGANIQLPGGLSGKLLHHRSISIVQKVYQKVESKIPIVGVGGVDSGETALHMIKAGASLIQIYTGFVYQGPSLIKNVNEYLAETTIKCGCKSYKELVGVSSKGSS